MEHQKDCESSIRAKLAELEPQVKKATLELILYKNQLPDKPELLGNTLECSLRVLALECLKEQYYNHLLEHKVDKLEAHVLELELNVEDRISEAVRKYFEVRLDSKESE